MTAKSSMRNNATSARMKKLRRLGLGLRLLPGLIILLLSACGQSGPLYLPNAGGDNVVQVANVS